MHTIGQRFLFSHLKGRGGCDENLRHCYTERPISFEVFERSFYVQGVWHSTNSLSWILYIPSNWRLLSLGIEAERHTLYFSYKTTLTNKKTQKDYMKIKSILDTDYLMETWRKGIGLSYKHLWSVSPKKFKNWFPIWF